MGPVFSVIIATYNRADYLHLALDSLRAQEFADYEAIVVDDGSTDCTLSLLRDFPWVKVLRQKNSGPGASRNFGVRHSSGKYLAFLDSDDVWFPWTLATFNRVISDYGEPDLLAAKLLPFREDAELRVVTQEAPLALAFKDYYEASRMGYFVGAGMMVVRSTAFDRVGGFTDKRIYAEDADLALRFGLVKGFAQILAPATIAYRQHSGNACRDHELIYSGAKNLIESERMEHYPGGSSRRMDRLRLITMHTRPVSIDSVRNGYHRRGWALYWTTFAWHLRTRRWKYLLGFPIIGVLGAIGIGRQSNSK